MLFNILLIILVVYVIISPYFYAKAVRFGMSLEGNPPEETVFHLPKRKKQPKMTVEEQRTMQILQNIDRYDGTSKGQQEIK